MIDLRQSIEFADLPDILIFPDDRLSGAYYALPEAPRLARDERGKAELRLMLFGERTERAFESSTGFVSCSTTLALTSDENHQIREKLQSRLLEIAESGRAIPPLRMLGPDWREGRVELHLTPELRLSGRPSLFGANQCSVSRRLDDSRLGKLVAAWRSGLNDALIIYRLELSTGSKAASARRQDEHRRNTSAGTSRNSRFSIDVEQTQHQSIPVSLTLRGSLGLSAAELAASITEIDQGPTKAR
jgi:hypothetical protein